MIGKTLHRFERFSPARVGIVMFTLVLVLGVALFQKTRIMTILEPGDDIEVRFTGIRPGEKIHEIMVSEEECFRTSERNDYYVILPILPELRVEDDFKQVLQGEYSSQHDNLEVPALRSLLREASGEIAQFA